jgi:hypothetical protein
MQGLTSGTTPRPARTGRWLCFLDHRHLFQLSAQLPQPHAGRVAAATFTLWAGQGIIKEGVVYCCSVSNALSRPTHSVTVWVTEKKKQPGVGSCAPLPLMTCHLLHFTAHIHMCGLDSAVLFRISVKINLPLYTVSWQFPPPRAHLIHTIFFIGFRFYGSIFI